VKRRQFITLIGGVAAAWPLVAGAQQSAMPVIGFLHSQSPDTNADRLRGFHRGLKESGFIEGENVSIDYRWAENQVDRLPVLAAELVRRQVAVIVALGGTAPAIAAKALNTTIPVVFGVPEDPVKLGLVTSLARPGGNLTGINFFVGELLAKRLELLRELVPAAARVAVFVNPANPARAELAVEAESAGRAMGLQIQVLSVSTSSEINAAFATLGRDRPDALLVSPDPFFVARRIQLANLAARHVIPSSFSVRENAEAGGLMSYGADISDAYRQMGVYAGRVLKGAKPADLPVLQSTKFEFVINVQTATMLGLTVPPQLLARADEVTE